MGSTERFMMWTCIILLSAGAAFDCSGQEARTRTDIDDLKARVYDLEHQQQPETAVPGTTDDDADTVEPEQE
jgi:hypothetical protein